MADTKRINKIRAELLLQDFAKLKDQVSTIKDLIQTKMDQILVTTDLIKSEEVEQINVLFLPLRLALQEYTKGLPSYLRSVGKMEPQKKPEKAFLDSVRSVLTEAREIEEDFDWMLERFNHNVTIHNMALGDLTSFMENPSMQEKEPVLDDSEAPEQHTESEDASEDTTGIADTTEA